MNNPDNIIKMLYQSYYDGKGAKEAKQDAENVSKSVVFETGKFAALGVAIKKVAGYLKEATIESANYIESLNVLQVAFDGNTESIRKFSSQLADTLNLNDATIINSAAHFKVLSQSMGMATETGEKLSKLMTKMTLDLSSLYNIDFNKAQTALQYAMEGRGTSLKQRTGVSVLETSVQTTLDVLGIDAYVENMNDAEKAIARVISMEYQLMSSQGDLARTIEAPANQMRVLKEQINMLSRNIGNVLIPIVSKLLPYLNAIFIVLNAIISALARLVGYKEDMFDTFESANVIDYFDDIGSSIDGIGDSAERTAKKLQGLRGFDKLNVIKTPTETGSGSLGGGSGAGGINPNLLKAFNEMADKYKNTLDEVETKATRIAKQILHWLGFTEQINEETGKLEWKFDHITGGTVLGALAVGGVIFLGVKKILDMFKDIKGIGSLVFGKDKGNVEAVGNVMDLGNTVSKKSEGFKIPNPKEIAKGMADLAIIVLGTIAIVEAVGLLTKIPDFKKIATEGINELKEVFWGLALVSPPLVAVGASMAIMGKMEVKTFTKGLADLALIIGGTEILILALGWITSSKEAKEFVSSGIDSTKKIFNGLGDIIVPLIEISSLIAVLGLIGTEVATGLLAFSAIVFGLGGILELLGLLMQSEGAKELIDKGGETLMQIGNIIGGFAGSIIEGFLNKTFEGIEEAGKQLANFMINAQPFFDGLRNVNGETLKSVAYLASAILMLTASNILEGLTSWFTGGTSLVDFGRELREFAPYFAEYSFIIKDVDSEVVKASSEAAMTLAEFASKLPNSGGLKDLFTGSNDLSSFSKVLPSFGKNLKAYSDNVKGLDTNLVVNSISAATSISEFASKLPNSGGLKDLFTGRNDLDKFGEMLPSFGKNMKKYADNVKGIDNNVVDNSIKSAKSIAEMAKILPNSGGIVSWFTGDNKLSDFGSDMKKFGEHFKSYYDKIKNINVTTVDEVTKSVNSLIDSFIKVKNNNLSETIKNFGTALSNAGNDIKNYLTSSFNYDNGYGVGYNFGLGFAQGMSNAIRWSNFPTLKLTGPDGNSLQNYKLSAFASGGMPDVGQLFIANERGPELVGSIGGQSFVANQNQMLDIIDKKLQNSGGVKNATFIIQVGNKEIAKQVITDLQEMAVDNGKPITIGG